MDLSWISYVLLALVLGFFLFVLIKGIINKYQGKGGNCCCSSSKGKKLVKQFHKLKKQEAKCPYCQNGESHLNKGDALD